MLGFCPLGGKALAVLPEILPQIFDAAIGPFTAVIRTEVSVIGVLAAAGDFIVHRPAEQSFVVKP